MQRVFAAVSLCAFLAWAVCAAPPAAPAYAPLTVYQGSWKVTRKSAGANAKPDELQNQCAPVGKFFTCQQAVNGSVVALLVFVPLKEPGRVATQSVLPEGRAAGRGELEISGNRWVFTSSWNQGSTTTTRYRTTNIIQNKNHIHFEQEESTDGAHWEVKDSGDDVRIGPAGR